MLIENIGNSILINGDCEEFIKELPDNSITLIHTDPPYVIHSGVQKSKMFDEKDKFLNISMRRYKQYLI